MPSRTVRAGHTRAFDYPVMGHWGEPKCSVARVGLEPTTHANPLSQLLICEGKLTAATPEAIAEVPARRRGSP